MSEYESIAKGKISAVILAAGMSTRMGRPKMVLPWGTTTIIGQVVTSVSAAGVQPIVVVTGGAREEVEKALEGRAILFAFNPGYANGEMIYSIQTGIRGLDSQVDAFLLVLGDQPQVEVAVIRQLIAHYVEKRSSLVVPSYQMRRGHPWLVDRALWDELLKMQPPDTMRDFINRHPKDIAYITVDSESILHDLDTPEDYNRLTNVSSG